MIVSVKAKNLLLKSSVMVVCSSLLSFSCTVRGEVKAKLVFQLKSAKLSFWNQLFGK